MSTFGDDTPDDAWNADDPPLDRLGVLVRRLQYEHGRLALLLAGGLTLGGEDRERLLTCVADLGRILEDLEP